MQKKILREIVLNIEQIYENINSIRLVGICEKGIKYSGTIFKQTKNGTLTSIIKQFNFLKLNPGDTIYTQGDTFTKFNNKDQYIIKKINRAITSGKGDWKCLW